MSNVQILVVDDEPDILQLLKISLGRMGLTVFTASTVGAAKIALDKTTFHFCLTDMKMPDGNGLELVEYVNKKYPNTPIAVITAYGTINHAVEALKKGAFDFITKPISIEILRNLVINAIKESTSPHKKTNKQLTTQLAGTSDYIQKVNKNILQFAKSQSYIIINGPSGTSKKMIAKCIHNSSLRSSKVFYSYDCIGEHQEVHELFGNKSHKGLLAEANGSTLFLENIDGLTLSMQNKLLNILLNNKIITDAGSEISLDIRFISSSKHDLKQKIEQGDFKQALYDKLCIIETITQPLIFHKEDIPGLCKKILNDYSKTWQQLPCKIDSEALHTLCTYDFPGNINELKKTLEKAVNFCENNIIRKEDLGLSESKEQSLISQRQDKNLEDYIEEIEVQEISKALKQTNNNKTAAAKILGISFRALRYRIKKLNLD